MKRIFVTIILAGVAFLNAQSGDLEITVADASGITVFQTTVNAASGSSVIISTTGWSKGAYTLIIADDAGGCLKGSFNIKK